MHNEIINADINEDLNALNQMSKEVSNIIEIIKLELQDNLNTDLQKELTEYQMYKYDIGNAIGRVNRILNK